MEIGNSSPESKVESSRKNKCIEDETKVLWVGSWSGRYMGNIWSSYCLYFLLSLSASSSARYLIRSYAQVHLTDRHLLNLSEQTENNCKIEPDQKQRNCASYRIWSWSFEKFSAVHREHRYAGCRRANLYQLFGSYAFEKDLPNPYTNLHPNESLTRASLDLTLVIWVHIKGFYMLSYLIHQLIVRVFIESKFNLYIDCRMLL